MLLNSSTTLPGGLRVSLRLPHSRDRAGLVALHARLGRELDLLEASRLLRHDPRRRAAVCAEAFTPAGPTLVGFAAGDVGASGPDVVVADPSDVALLGLLTQALTERTGPARRPRVA